MQINPGDIIISLYKRQWPIIGNSLTDEAFEDTVVHFRPLPEYVGNFLPLTLATVINVWRTTGGILHIHIIASDGTIGYIRGDMNDIVNDVCVIWRAQ